MDITTKTIDELKALAYDQIVILERTKTNLQLINGEIEKRGAEQGLGEAKKPLNKAENK